MIVIVSGSKIPGVAGAPYVGMLPADPSVRTSTCLATCDGVTLVAG